MSGQPMILDPAAPSRNVSRQQHRPLHDLRGKVVGFIDNSKPNFNHLVDDIAELLAAKHGIASVVKHRKRAASIPAPDAVMKDLARCDLVITGSGD